MNTSQGAIVLARKVIESDVFFVKPDKWFKMWIFILCYVNHKDNDHFTRGENFFTYRQIMDATRATKDQCDKFLQWSRKSSMLATRKTTRGVIIKVIKYDIFQNFTNYKSDMKSETEAKQKRNRSDTINKNVTMQEGNNENTNTMPPDGDDIEKLLNEGSKIQYDFQFVGLDIFQKTNAPANKRGECIRIAKKYPNYVNRALSFASDYPLPQLKWKMFLWKLNEQIKNAKIAT